jgi:hypothetical protein
MNQQLDARQPTAVDQIGQPGARPSQGITTTDTVVFGVAAVVLTIGAVLLYRPLFTADRAVTNAQRSGRRRRPARR